MKRTSTKVRERVRDALTRFGKSLKESASRQAKMIGEAGRKRNPAPLDRRREERPEAPDPARHQPGRHPDGRAQDLQRTRGRVEGGSQPRIPPIAGRPRGAGRPA